MRENTSEHPFIVLEGSDGAGKTTVSRELSGLIGATFLRTPTGELDNFRRFYDARDKKHASYFFYLSSVIVASEEIECLLKEHPVICDRYVYSSCCSHRHMDVDVDIVSINDLPILRPDFVFLLTVEEETRKQRFIERGEVVSDQEMKVIRDYEQELRAHATHVIDTTKNTPRQTAFMIMQKILES